MFKKMRNLLADWVTAGAKLDSDLARKERQKTLRHAYFTDEWSRHADKAFDLEERAERKARLAERLRGGGDA